MEKDFSFVFSAYFTPLSRMSLAAKERFRLSEKKELINTNNDLIAAFGTDEYMQFLHDAVMKYGGDEESKKVLSLLCGIADGHEYTIAEFCEKQNVERCKVEEIVEKYQNQMEWRFKHSRRICVYPSRRNKLKDYLDD